MSKKITQESVSAFLDCRPFNKSNMEVTREGTIYYLKLYGNKIAALEADGRMWISNAGWKSNTTKERLNGLPGVSVNQKDWDWYLNGQLWDGSPQYVRQL
jgi:hypothetical protein